MVVRVHCFPLQQQNQQMQALKTSYSFNIVVRIQFPPKQELLEKKIFLIPKTVPMISSWQSTPEVIHPLGHHVAPLHQLPLGFRFKMMDPGLIPMTICDRQPSPPASYWCKRSVVNNFFLRLCQLSWQPISTHLETAWLSSLWIRVTHFTLEMH
jgi:hypothetical protein